MVKSETLNVYEYPIRHPNGTTYNGSYTIKKGIKPMGYKGEHLVQTFTTNVRILMRRHLARLRRRRLFPHQIKKFT